MIFEIKYNHLSFSIWDIRYFHIAAKDGNPYNTTFKVKVLSEEGFSGISGFECDYKDFKEFIKQINELYSFKINKVELNDICYGSKIEFELDKYGHIELFGEIYGSAQEHSLSFKFSFDQTCLMDFANSLDRELKKGSFIMEGLK